MTKVCSKCGRDLPLEMYSKNVTKKDGRACSCKDCNKQWRQANKERLAKVARQYYEENKTHLRDYSKQYRKENKERVNERNKKWYEKNKEDRIARARQYYEMNKDRVIKRQKQYERANADIYRIRKHMRRAKIKQLPNNLTVEQWNKIKGDFNNRCCYCGKELPLEQEHFIPLTKGGEYTANNILAACKSCNCSKNNKDFFEWYPKFKYYSKKREEHILEYLGYKDEKQQLSIVI